MRELTDDQRKRLEAAVERRCGEGKVPLFETTSVALAREWINAYRKGEHWAIEAKSQVARKTDILNRIERL